MRALSRAQWKRRLCCCSMHVPNFHLHHWNTNKLLQPCINSSTYSASWMSFHETARLFIWKHFVPYRIRHTLSFQICSICPGLTLFAADVVSMGVLLPLRACTRLFDYIAWRTARRVNEFTPEIGLGTILMLSTLLARGYNVKSQDWHGL